MPGILAKRQYTTCSRYDNNCYYDDSDWNRWGRWVALVLIFLGFFFLFFFLSCLSARRRRTRGLSPYYGTGWTQHGPAVYNQHAQGPYNSYQQPHNGYYGQTQEPAPPYGAPPPKYENRNNGPIYGEGSNNVEMQPPAASHQPYGNNEQYMSPAGAPPKKSRFNFFKR